MLDIVMPYLNTAESRSVRAYQHFKQEQIRYVAKQRERIFKSLGHESYGVRLLRYILQFVDHEYLDSRTNNYERYTEHLRYIRRDLMSTFDYPKQGRGYRNFFVEKSNFITEEFILPIEDVNTIINLPLDTNDWNVWRHVHPLRLWNHDSDELTMKLLNGRIGFNTMPPSHAVFLLDVIALVFKYYIWNKYERDNEPAQNLAQEVPQQLFLNKYVICDLFWDLLDIWLLRNMVKLFQMEDPLEVEHAFDSNALQTHQFYGRIGISSRKGYLDLWKTCTVSTMIPAIICNSNLLCRGSIRYRLNHLLDKAEMPRNSAYDYLRWLRDRDILKFIVLLFNKRPTLGQSVSLRRRLYVEAVRWNRRRPWNTPNNTVLKAQIESELKEFEDWLA